MGLGTIVRIAIVAVVAIVVAFEFGAGFTVIGCDVTSAQDGIRACTVEATCEDGATREARFKLSRHERCPKTAWYSPLWGTLRKPSITGGYAWSLVAGLLGALAFGPAGLLDPREKDPGIPEGMSQGRRVARSGRSKLGS